MGMEGKLRQISEFELASYRKDPGKAYDAVINRYKSPDLMRLRGKMKELESSPILKRIQARVTAGQPPDPEDTNAYHAQMGAILAENQQGLAELQSLHMGLSKGGQELSLHKSWHCLHFLLTGKSWDPVDSPLGKAILGGKEIPDRHNVMGYGPIRYLTPDEVRQVAEALAGFPIAARASAFDPVAAEEAKVYVPEHDAEELTHHFGLLKDFYRDAADKNNAMLLWVV